jgi:hypothetical protein
MTGFHGEGDNGKPVDQLEFPPHVITAAYEVVSLRLDQEGNVPLQCVELRGILHAGLPR